MRLYVFLLTSQGQFQMASGTQNPRYYMRDFLKLRGVLAVNSAHRPPSRIDPVDYHDSVPYTIFAVKKCLAVNQ